MSPAAPARVTTAEMVTHGMRPSNLGQRIVLERTGQERRNAGKPW